MNERDFILLVEQYLDGSITPKGRADLKAEVLSHPERKRIFEEQTRQHIRLHAQTSRVDFSESQRIAFIVVDIVEKQKHPNAFMDLIRQKTFRERAMLILRGLRAEKESAAHRAAKAELVRMVGPVSFSVVVNVAALLLLFFWVPYVLPPQPPSNLPPEPDGVTVILGTPNPGSSVTPVEPPRGDLQANKTTSSSDSTSPAAGLSSTPSSLVSTPQVQPDVITVSGGDGDTTHDDTAIAPPDSLRGIPSGISMVSIGSRGTNDRAAALETHHATQTDSAVIKSLRWLKEHQKADGCWPGQDTTAMSGLALLAYLAHGETPVSPEFGITVTRGLKYLLGQQDSKGSFSQNVYAHAIATYAIAEASTMTRIVELKIPLEKAARVILDGQQSNGGFDYNYRKEQRFDTSVTGWQIQALKATLIAGADVPGLDDALVQSIRFLQSDAFARDGSGFVYEGKPGIPAASGGRPSMTGVGTLCLQMLGKSASPQVRTGLKALQKAELDWPATGKVNVYSGYYVTQAKFQSGSRTDWMQWNLKMQKVLLAKQHRDGHWEQGDYDNGSFVYSTALCTLMLEVYYRYLPTYIQRPDPELPQKNASRDVSIDIR
ncbi:MAG: prenyltransferase/squalene oxidase repeat-containing protein [bacterium]